MNLLFATTNAGKMQEAAAILREFGITVTQAAVEIGEPKTLSLQETAVKKAENAFSLLKKPVVVEDTGIFFDAYKNFPGTYTKFAVQTIGIAGMLKMLEGKNRKACFKTITAFADGKSVETFEGSVQGTIALRPAGNALRSLPYDSIFIPEKHKKTFAQMAESEKNKFSHRAVAFRKLGEWLQ